MDDVSEQKIPLPDDIPFVGPLQFDVVIDVDENGNVIPKPPLPKGLEPDA
jgi:hypothetical protein